ncbi:MAG TPA: hypothetical protein DEA90_07765 [Opitutae bacterium]|nr:hypothetical protein [Puniceicoccaceae bacterium]HBR94046.1 hypothetical protein [Opitutae bacterium]|tara:strand:- start:69 stop:989 length:921 start_codon:yes stop_codon:yes gene_type:complete
MRIGTLLKNKRRAKQRRKEESLLQRQETKLRIQQLTEHTLHSKTPGTRNNSDHEIVISLTTFDKRIESTYIAVESLMQQSFQADRIVLCISKQDFSEADIPATLKKQQSRGLEILFCEEDLGPYTKYFYTVQKYPNSIVITVDDDFIYPPYLVDQLYRAFLKNPHAIHCHRSHKMRFSKTGQLAPYKEWHWDHVDSSPSLLIFPTGVGGVLYFPGCLDIDVINKDAFLKRCPNADDIWLKAMSLKKGIQCAQVKDCRPWSSRFLPIEGTQEFSLKRENKKNGTGNDHKIKCVFDHYDLWAQLEGSK